MSGDGIGFTGPIPSIPMQWDAHRYSKEMWSIWWCVFWDKITQYIMNIFF